MSEDDALRCGSLTPALPARQKGVTAYQIAMVNEEFITVGSNVYLKGEEGEENYIARVIKLFERNRDGAKMMTCQWYYRVAETILRTQNGTASKLARNELLLSDVIDDNLLSTVVGPCDVGAPLFPQGTVALFPHGSLARSLCTPSFPFLSHILMSFPPSPDAPTSQALVPLVPAQPSLKTTHFFPSRSILARTVLSHRVFMRLQVTPNTHITDLTAFTKTDRFFYHRRYFPRVSQVRLPRMTR